ncbi:hypothetical protein TYRP_017137 [Tyrophagus putrescentiae]|nr:hypothetical protein TYRP_017137 [Tyrophagus putrescentiae]
MAVGSGEAVFEGVHRAVGRLGVLAKAAASEAEEDRDHRDFHDVCTYNICPDCLSLKRGRNRSKSKVAEDLVLLSEVVDKGSPLWIAVQLLDGRTEALSSLAAAARAVGASAGTCRLPVTVPELSEGCVKDQVDVLIDAVGGQVEADQLAEAAVGLLRLLLLLLFYGGGEHLLFLSLQRCLHGGGDASRRGGWFKLLLGVGEVLHSGRSRPLKDERLGGEEGRDWTGDDVWRFTTTTCIAIAHGQTE